MRTYKSKAFRDTTDPFTTIDTLSVQTKVIEILESIEWGYEGLKKEKHLNLAYAVISTINHAFWRMFKVDRDRQKFVRLQSKSLERLVGDLYNPICKFLIKAGIIERGKRYWNTNGRGKGFCKEFRIAPELAEGYCRSIAVFGPNKFPDRLRAVVEAPRTESLMSAQHELIRDNTFKLRQTNEAGWQFYLNYGHLYDCFDEPKSEQMIQTQSNFLAQLSASHGPFRAKDCNDAWFKVDDYGRFYSSFTHLFKEARSDIYLDGEPIIGIDIHASHWFHALMLWPDRESAEGQRILKILKEGDLYKFLMDAWSIDDRDATKIPSLIFLHSHPKRVSTATELNSKKLADLFPNFVAWILEQKEGPVYLDCHKPFSNALMREESDRVILDAVGKLAVINSEYPVVSLHDALFVPVSRADEVLEVFRSVYQDCYGVVPKISKDCPEEVDSPCDDIEGFLDEDAELAEAA